MTKILFIAPVLQRIAADGAGRNAWAVRRGGRIVGPLLLCLLAVALSIPRLGGPPEFDELYHVLAARGWLDTGRFAIAEGEYTRTSLYTLVIAYLFQTFGETVSIARIPAVACYSLLAGCFFIWLRRETTAGAAWIASLLLVLSPFLLEAGTVARFYAAQTLAFFVGAVLIYAAVTDQGSKLRRSLLTMAACLMLAVAVYFQVATLIGIGGILLWLAVDLLLPRFLNLPSGAKLRLLVFALVMGLGAMMVLLRLPLSEFAIARFWWVPDFQRERANQFWFYHQWLLLLYPTLWSLSLLFFIASLRQFPSVTCFCVAIFPTCFVLHSIAAAKDMRYITYALPFLFAIFGMGLAALWPRTRQFLVANLLPWMPQSWPRERRRRAVVVLTVTVVVCSVLANGFAPRLVTMLAGIRLPPQPPLVRWQMAADDLAPWMNRVDVVITNDELAALYYMRDYDVLLSRSRLSELRPAGDFARDRRTGRPVIASAEALRLILDCFSDGLVVVDRHKLTSAGPEIAVLLVQETRILPLPRSWAVDAFVWERRPVARDPSLCPDIKRRKVAAARVGIARIASVS